MAIAWEFIVEAPISGKEFALVGLLCDIVGVVILAMALLGVRGSTLRAQAGTYWGGNLGLLRALFARQYDAWGGVSILVVGFLLQAIGVIGVVIPASVRWFWLLLLLALTGFLLLRRYAVKRRFERLKAEPSTGDITRGRVAAIADAFNVERS